MSPTGSNPRTGRWQRLFRWPAWAIWAAVLIVAVVEVGVFWRIRTSPVTYRNEQFSYSIVMPKRFSRDVQLREEENMLFFVYKPVQALEPRFAYGVVGRLEIHDKAATTEEQLQLLSRLYGLALIGENPEHYFGSAQATDVQVPQGASEQTLARFRELQAEFRQVIKSFKLQE